MKPFIDDPIMKVQWIENTRLSPNLFNPNVVMDQELKLLEFSILKSGYIQPILVSTEFMICDGFHRFRLSQISQSIIARYGNKVPCVVMPLTLPQAMLLTIRINRAKGTHQAFKMAEIVRALIDEHHLDPQQIEQEIGAYKGEVELLYQSSIFKQKNLAERSYSRAWEPRKSD